VLDPAVDEKSIDFVSILRRHAVAKDLRRTKEWL
jgi:hypothetical protein